MIESARRAFVLVMASALVAAAQQPVPVEGPKPLAVLKHGAEIGTMALRFSPDGKTLASGGTDGYIRLWDVAKWRERAAMEAPAVVVRQPSLHPPHAPVSVVAFSPDGKTLATGGQDGAVSLWDPVTGRKTGTLDPQPRSSSAWWDAIRWMEFSANGRTLVSTGRSSVYHLWDMDTHRPRDVAGPFDGAVGIGVSNDGQRLVATDLFNTHGEGKDQGQALHVRDADSGRTSPKSPLPRISTPELVDSPDGEWFAWAEQDGLIRLFRHVDTLNYEGLPPIKGHRGAVADLAFSRYAPVLASAGQGDHMVRIWRVPSGEPLAVLGGFKGPVSAVEFSPNGRTLAAAGHEGLIRVWDLQTVLDATPAAKSPR